MDFHTLLTGLGVALKIDALDFDSHGICKLIFDDCYTVYLELGRDESTLHLYSIIGELPQNGQASFFESLSSRNLFGASTGLWNLACDIERQELLLNGRFRRDHLNVNNLIDLVHDFVDQTETQIKWLLRFTHGDASKNTNNNQNTSFSNNTGINNNTLIRV